MTYRLNVLSDLPVGYWQLNSSLADASGFGFDGVVQGVPQFNERGLTAGGGSTTFTGAAFATVDFSSVLVQGKESESFSIEAWVKVDEVPAERRLVAGRSDSGIFVTPDGVEFSIASTDGEIYSARYTVTDWTFPLYAVARYIGGDLSITVNLREGSTENFDGAFTALPANEFYIGGNTISSSTTITVSDVAVYRRPLSTETIRLHHLAATSASSPYVISEASGGTYYAFDDSTADVALLYSEGDTVVAEEITSQLSDIEYVGHLSNIAGSRIDWNGSSGVSVDISLNNGQTWTPCENHVEVPGLTPNAYLAGKFFMLRKSFANAGDRLDSLSLVVYQSKTSSANMSVSAAGVYGSPTLAAYAYSPIRNADNMGVTLDISSYLTVPATVEPVQTVEFWVKRTSDTTEIIGSPQAHITMGGNLTSSGFETIYANGVADPTINSFPVGEWVHLIGVLMAPLSDVITVNNNGTGSTSIAHLALYPDAFTEQDVSVHYSLAVGLPTAILADAAAGSVVETLNPIRGYNNAWSTVVSGVV